MRTKRRRTRKKIRIDSRKGKKEEGRRKEGEEKAGPKVGVKQKKEKKRK